MPPSSVRYILYVSQPQITILYSAFSYIHKIRYLLLFTHVQRPQDNKKVYAHFEHLFVKRLYTLLHLHAIFILNFLDCFFFTSFLCLLLLSISILTYQYMIPHCQPSLSDMADRYIFHLQTQYHPFLYL